jgi:N-glycosidase YbiA
VTQAVISRFTGRHSFLSNFFLRVMWFEADWYPSAEHAYQAAKTDDVAGKKAIAASPSPAIAKRLGQRVPLRRDWERVKVEIMRDVVRAKFRGDLELRKMLLATGEATLVEGNNWGDRFWGVDGHGENHLGRILMEVRTELRVA